MTITTENEKKLRPSFLLRSVVSIPARYYFELTKVADPTISTVLAPELRQDVVSALDDSDETTRQTAHKTVHKLAQNGLYKLKSGPLPKRHSEIVCAAIATLQMIVKLHDGDEATVRASVEALSYSPHCRLLLAER